MPDAVRRVAEAVAAPNSETIDDQTWHDLDLDGLVQQATASASLLGQHRLYGLLRHGEGAEERAALRDMVAALIARPDAEALIRSSVFKPLHELDFDPSSALFCDLPMHVPAWTRHLRLFVPAAMLASAALLVSGWAIVPIAALVAVSAGVQIRLYGTLSAWQRTRRSLLAMLRAADSLDAMGDAGVPKHVGGPFSNGAGLAREMSRALKPSVWHQSPQLAEQLNLFTLSEYVELVKQLSRFEALRTQLRQVHLRLGTLEAALCVVAQLRGAKWHCRATISPAQTELKFEQLGNPLVPNMVPVPALQVLDGGLLLTGQNGVGKSTLLRTVGLNLVMARSFGHCFASTADLCDAEVVSSISVVDSSEQGLSLYMAQVRCAVAMLERARRARHLVVLVDEILGGSNYLDSVSASAAVLYELSKHATVLVSTHHVLLAPLLRGVLRPMQLQRRADGSVELTDGVLVETNGRSILKQLGMPESVAHTAEALAAWLSAYLVDPPECPVVASFDPGACAP